MIRLFESTATYFLSNGLGSLPDVSKCEVVEERNGSFELEMNYHISGKRYSDLELGRIIVAKPNPYANPQPFRIYSISKPMNGLVTIKAEHISYDMAGYPVSRFTASNVGEAFKKLKSESVVENCPFIFSLCGFDDDSSSKSTYEDDSDSNNKSTCKNDSNSNNESTCEDDSESDCEFVIQKPASMRSILGGSTGSILDVYGGEYEFDGYNTILHKERGIDRGVTIRYGKNMTDLNQEENCSNVYTAVYPYFLFEDKENEQSILVELPEKTIPIPDATYNYTRIYPLDVATEWKNIYEWHYECPSDLEIREIAQKYISDHELGKPKVSLTVSFEQLSQSEEYAALEMLETVHLCDKVNVEFPKLGVSATSKCIKTTYNVLTGKYISIELGEARSNLASSIVSQNYTVEEKIDNLPTKPFITQEVEKAAKIISGSLGGYVAIHSSTGSNCPDEILIMDTDDIAKAQKVWKWNHEGLGYSDNGYHNSYVTVINDAGKIIADHIRGTLTIGGTGNMEGKIEINNQYNQPLIKLDKDGISFSDSGKKPIVDIVKDTITADYVNGLDISVAIENLIGTVIEGKKIISKSSEHHSEIRDGVISSTLVCLLNSTDTDDSEPIILNKDTMQGILQEIADLKQEITDLKSGLEERV